MPTSPRLTYRRLAHADTNLFRALCLDEHVKEYLLDGADVSPEWAVEAVALSERLFETTGVGLWLVLRDDEPIGFCGFRLFPALGAEP